MSGRYFRILGILSSFIIAGCSAESAPAPWQLTQQGEKGLYQAELNCVKAPDIGPFQDCKAVFQTIAGQPFIPDVVLLDGGMPNHGHGLPTSPVLTALEEEGHYRIDGLKYNMHGFWLLGFKLKGAQGEDQVVFDFVI